MGELRQAHVMCSEILEEILTQLILNFIVVQRCLL